ncbi:MAG: rhodanese-like domain-containing protein [Alphaproteobacteria bacterium]|jgi:rhodanese-related sulfurtransferase|nr:rhodanese-like domain-containing protein [Alphaproteobacteria bacterium]MDP6515315.1 rhodanese-like domain-containing protein [Alphaproteobacteria bacterium]
MTDAEIATANGYAGDVTPRQAWDMLGAEKDAVLIDVRTDAEWNYVGVPNLEAVGKAPVLVPWQHYPDMSVNPDFVGALDRLGIARNATVLLLCRSGARSRAAAIAMSRRGYAHCYNVSDGFEGGHDGKGHRGGGGGWKAEGLPWTQG